MKIFYMRCACARQRLVHSDGSNAFWIKCAIGKKKKEITYLQKMYILSVNRHFCRDRISWIHWFHLWISACTKYTKLSSRISLAKMTESHLYRRHRKYEMFFYLCTYTIYKVRRIATIFSRDNGFNFYMKYRLKVS